MKTVLKTRISPGHQLVPRDCPHISHCSSSTQTVSQESIFDYFSLVFPLSKPLLGIPIKRLVPVQNVPLLFMLSRSIHKPVGNK